MGMASTDRDKASAQPDLLLSQRREHNPCDSPRAHVIPLTPMGFPSRPIIRDDLPTSLQYHLRHTRQLLQVATKRHTSTHYTPIIAPR